MDDDDFCARILENVARLFRCRVPVHRGWVDTQQAGRSARLEEREVVAQVVLEGAHAVGQRRLLVVDGDDDVDDGRPGAQLVGEAHVDDDVDRARQPCQHRHSHRKGADFHPYSYSRGIG